MPERGALSAGRRPPVFPGWPLLGSLPDYLRDRLGFTAKCARFGPVVQVRLPGPPVYVVADPAAIEETLVTKNASFIKDEMTRQLGLVIGRGLFTSDGEVWRQRRRAAQPAFHRDRIEAHGDTMTDAIERMMVSWKDGATRDIHVEMGHAVMDIAARALFGVALGPDLERFGRAFDTVLRRYGDWRYEAIPGFDRLPIAANRRMRRAVAEIDEVIGRMIEDRRRRPQASDDFFGLLLEMHDPDGTPISDRDLRDEILIMLIAAHETSANSLAWTWMLLSQHPDVEAALLAELRAVLGDRPPTIEDVPHLAYTGHVLHESLRLYPPAWALGREAVEDVEIGGFSLPRRAQLLIAQWALLRDPRFFERPEVFDPARWADGLARRLPRGLFVPFGAGPRMCIGHAFAVTEMVLMVAGVAQRFELRLAPGFRPDPLATVTLRPRHGIPMIVRQRSSGTSTQEGARARKGSRSMTLDGEP